MTLAAGSPGRMVDVSSSIRLLFKQLQTTAPYLYWTPAEGKHQHHDDHHSGYTLLAPPGWVMYEREREKERKRAEKRRIEKRENYTSVPLVVVVLSVVWYKLQARGCKFCIEPTIQVRRVAFGGGL